MPVVFLPDLRLNAEISGPADGAALVLIHALGTDLHLWDHLIPLLPPLHSRQRRGPIPILTNR